MKLTGWYRPDQKPVMSGEYEIAYASFRLFWNMEAQQWGIFDCGHWYAYTNQNLPWRGIAK